MIEVIPAIIPESFEKIREKLSLVEGQVHKVQIDIVDGKYAPPKTWPLMDSSQYTQLSKIVAGQEKFPYIDSFKVEIDMMILHPIEYLSDFLSIGAKSFVVHIDSTSHIKECIDTIKHANCNVGLGIKPSTDLQTLQPFLLDIDFVQFMGSDKVGYGGVELDINVYNKISNLHNDHPSIPIQIDIGVNFDTPHKLIMAGASALVSGSTIFDSPNIRDAIIKLQNS